MSLKILGGGAAQGLVDALADRFMAGADIDISGTFAAVGAMREKLVTGTPADLVILTAAVIADLVRDGHVVADTTVDIGRVRTAIAVPKDQPDPPIGTAAALRMALLTADAFYVPDTKLSTAGVHVAKMLDRLGIAQEMAPRLRSFPTGVVAMRELARPKGRPIGCTQATEIRSTPGIRFVGPLPEGFELTTVYTAGVCTAAKLPDLARRFIATLSAPEAAETRANLGFEPVG